MKPLVKCNRAGTVTDCKDCYHAKPHECQNLMRDHLGRQMLYCTEWRECWITTARGIFERMDIIKVRCVRVPPNV